MTTSASLTASIKTVVITEGLPKYNELGLNFYCLLVLSTGSKHSEEIARTNVYLSSPVSRLK